MLSWPCYFCVDPGRIKIGSGAISGVSSGSSSLVLCKTQKMQLGLLESQLGKHCLFSYPTHACDYDRLDSTFMMRLTDTGKEMSKVYLYFLPPLLIIHSSIKIFKFC